MAVILNARGLCKSFGAVSAAAEVNAAIERDSVVGLIGTNGAGKTTFINMITGYLKPDRGTIEFEGRDITLLEPREKNPPRRALASTTPSATIMLSKTLSEP